MIPLLPQPQVFAVHSIPVKPFYCMGCMAENFWWEIFLLTAKIVFEVISTFANLTSISNHAYNMSLVCIVHSRIVTILWDQTALIHNWFFSQQKLKPSVWYSTLSNLNNFLAQCIYQYHSTLGRIFDCGTLI